MSRSDPAHSHLAASTVLIKTYHKVLITLGVKNHDTDNLTYRRRLFHTWNVGAFHPSPIRTWWVQIEFQPNLYLDWQRLAAEMRN